ncbi:MAG: hypothetical protein GEV11_09135 [Streptosporangiales bacterium]|nr:hypothetical protein [Streptosporangiales bacterium]
MRMSRGTREPPKPPGPSTGTRGIWLANQVLSGILFLMVGGTFAVLAAMIARSVSDPDRDPHGYVQIFGGVFLVLLVLPLLLTGLATLLLVGVLFGSAWGVLIGLVGAGTAGVAVVGFIRTSPPPGGPFPPPAGPGYPPPTG